MSKISYLIFCFLAGFALLFSGCKTSNKDQTQPSLEEIVIMIQDGHKPTQIPQALIDSAQKLIDRSYAHDYKLIDAKDLIKLMQEHQVFLLEASPKGLFLLEHIKGAKHFEFDSTFLSPNGELLWNLDKGSQNEFQQKIGNNPFAIVVFYDQVKDPNDQATPADIASMWAKKLGYHNVYRLLGDKTSWVSQGLVMTHEVPTCCQ